MLNFVTCVENCQVYQLSLPNDIEITDKINCLYFGMILAMTYYSCISWFVVNTYYNRKGERSSFLLFRRRNTTLALLVNRQSHIKDNHMSWPQMTSSKPKTGTSRLGRPSHLQNSLIGRPGQVQHHRVRWRGWDRHPDRRFAH